MKRIIIETKNDPFINKFGPVKVNRIRFVDFVFLISQFNF